VIPLSLSIAGDAAEGVRAADYIFDPVAGTERMKAFGKRHQDKFGVLPNFATACSYNSVMLYAAALRSGARTPVQIRDFYKTVKGFDGVSGPITLDADGITTEEPVNRSVGTYPRKYPDNIYPDRKEVSPAEPSGRPPEAI